MARRTYEEYTRVWWAASGGIASKTAPTAAEINAATDISGFVPKDGLKPGMSNSKVKNDDITSAFSPEIPGSWSADLVLTCFRDDVADTAWNLFQTRNTAGFIVIRRMILVTTAVAAGQKVEVYPVSTMMPELQQTAENERQKFDLPLAVTSEPKLSATVA